MADPIKRIEKTHIDEVTRTATSSVQWFLEQRHIAGSHPITHNNELQVFIGGQESFADIAKEIRKAEASIDIICWGFDPGMELVRGEGKTWPRGDCYGDLLIAAGKRGVQVRLLVWYDAMAVGPLNPRNMPGYTHGTWPWYSQSGLNYAEKISANNSLSMLTAYCKRPFTLKPVSGEPYKSIRDAVFPTRKEDIPVKAREEYCHSWYEAARNGLLKAIHVRTRGGSAKHIKAGLEEEKKQPAAVRASGLERDGMIHGGTHHQKTILIDFAHHEGTKAVGYVMGLNSVTDYWDTNGHHLEDGMREQGTTKESEESLQGKEADRGFRTLKPYRDYACRISGGGALISLHKNFVTAWDRSVNDRTRAAANACTSRQECHSPPAALLRKAEKRAGLSSVQIVRTQPEEKDTSIKEIYFHAADLASNAVGYLYVENQYFQCEEWAQRLMAKRKAVMETWGAGGVKLGKEVEEMPLMHVFIVIPVPERAEMIPRTYDMLATLGQQESMTGQSAMIKNTNEHPRHKYLYDENLGPAIDLGPDLPEVVTHANDINKPNMKTLEDKFGLKICTAMLNTCGFEGGRWRYREIYIHSKLLMVDDTFFTLGSANLNMRSMGVDSEINLATHDHDLTQALRRRVWGQLTGDLAPGKNGTRQEIADAFKEWSRLMSDNSKKIYADSESANKKKMTGFLLPLKDNRSSTSRLG